MTFDPFVILLLVLNLGWWVLRLIVLHRRLRSRLSWRPHTLKAHTDDWIFSQGSWYT